jgi:hypothetical protein
MSTVKKSAAKQATATPSAEAPTPVAEETKVAATTSTPAPDGYVVVERNGVESLIDVRSLHELEPQGWKPVS